MTPEVQFQYARCLVRSKYPADIKKGIRFLEDLCNAHLEGQRDYFYYLAIGNARIREYAKALKCIKSAVNMDPNNKQMLKLEGLIKNRRDKEDLMNIALTGSFILICGVFLAVFLKWRKT